MRNKELESIDAAFELLLSRKSSKDQALASIEKSLKRIFSDYEFKVDMCYDTSHEFFGMSVYPSMDNMLVILDQIFADKPDTDATVEQWAKTSKWIIEIDSLLLTNNRLNVNPPEMTAILLHEIGHIIYDGTVPQRLQTVIRDNARKVNVKTREMMKMPKIHPILFPVIIEACSSKIYKYTGTREELAADKLVVQLGYGESLNSFLDKVIRTYGNSMLVMSEKDAEHDVTSIFQWSAESIDEMRFRKTKLRNSLNIQILKTPSKYTKKVLNDVKQKFFGKGVEKEFEEENKNILESMSFSEKRLFKMRDTKAVAESYYDSIEKEAIKIIEESIFDGPIRKLKKIDEMELDYIDIQIDKIVTHDDKTYVLDIIYYQNDLIDRALEYIEKGHANKVPNTKQDLLKYKKMLQDARKRAIAVPISKRNPLDVCIRVNYPQGYEG